MSWAMVHLLPVLFHNPCAQGRIWLKLAKQAEQRVRGTLEDLQKNMVGNPCRGCDSKGGIVGLYTVFLLIGMVMFGSFCHCTHYLSPPWSCSGISWATRELNLVCSSFAGSSLIFPCVIEKFWEERFHKSTYKYRNRNYISFLSSYLQWLCFYVLLRKCVFLGEMISRNTHTHIYLVPYHMTPSILVDSKIPSTYPWKIPSALHQRFETRNRSTASMPRAMGPRRRLKFAWRGRRGTVWGNDRKRRFDGIWLKNILGWIYGIVPSKFPSWIIMFWWKRRLFHRNVGILSGFELDNNVLMV